MVPNILALSLAVGNDHSLPKYRLHRLLPYLHLGLDFLAVLPFLHHLLVRVVHLRLDCRPVLAHHLALEVPLVLVLLAVQVALLLPQLFHLVPSLLSRLAVLVVQVHREVLEHRLHLLCLALHLVQVVPEYLLVLLVQDFLEVLLAILRTRSTSQCAAEWVAFAGRLVHPYLEDPALRRAHHCHPVLLVLVVRVEILRNHSNHQEAVVH